MKIIKNHHKALMAIAGLSIMGFGNAVASSNFSSQALVNFTVNNVPVDVLLGNAWFEVGANTDVGMLSGDGVGAVTPGYPGLSPLIVGGSYSFEPILVSGSVANGAVLNSVYAGWYNLELTNNSSAAIAVDLSLNYGLSALVGGQFGESETKLEYYLNNDFPLFERVYASSVGVNIESGSGSKLLSLQLNPGLNIFHADVAIASSIQAAPVPLPAAVWSFLAGLMGILGLKKRKQRPVESV